MQNSNIFQGFHQRNDWENPGITSIGREPAHIPWGAYGSREEALARETSENIMSLNGTWDFIFGENPGNLPENFFQKDSSLSWGNIQVPGHWELQGYDKPVYTNVLYPFLPESPERYLQDVRKSGPQNIHERYHPPFVPNAQNHVGLYKKQFTLPKAFLEKEVFIRFQGVESAYYLWVNGKPVGYSQDSKLPSEFLLTPYLVEGENIIVAAVLRFSDGTWLEDQDYFHVSGIYRCVELIAKPRAHLADIQADASLCEAGGRITARAFINSVQYYADYSVELALYDTQGKVLYSEKKGFATASEITGRWRFDPPAVVQLPRSAYFSFAVPQVQPWSCDTPTLYTAVFTLLDSQGNPVDYESVRLGFRTVEIRNNVILINGKRFVFRGVNRHEWAWPTGRVVSRDHMIAEIRRMKELNFNAVRTCHYPDDPTWYELCDEYGLCVVCETNLETHGVAGAITNTPEWGGAMLERAQRMVAIHKNHPCIVSWSLGNESGYGPNHAAMANWIRAYDSTRLVQYENCDPGSIASDIKCTMYPPIEALMKMIADNRDRRPIVLVEYAYQISNTTGGFDQFRKLTETYEIFQGGFIWDWQDKCLPVTAADGSTQFGYGGDWGEEIVDWEVPEYMVANGVVLPDLTPKPCAWEIKQGQSPVFIERAPGENTYCLKNRYHGLDTGILDCQAVVTAGGVEKERFPVSLPVVQPGSQALFQTSTAETAAPDSYLQFSLTLKQPLGLLPKGHKVADFQFVLAGRKAVQMRYTPKGETSLTETPQEITVTGLNFSITFQKESGLLTSYRRGGILCFSGTGENLSRARSGLHLEEKWWGPVQDSWDKLKPGAVTRSVRGVFCGKLGEDSIIRVSSTLTAESGNTQVETRYTVQGDGTLFVSVSMDMDAALVHVPRAGLGLVIQPDFEALSWFGRGPGESYCDRSQAAFMGEYHTTVEATHFPFVPPSHNGTHADTRWLKLTDSENRFIEVSGAPFYFDVHHNNILEYWQARHESDLVRHPESYLYLDGAHAGIGGDMAWSTEINDTHLLPAGTYRFSFCIRTGG